MGVILDSSILIAGERRRNSIAEVLERVESICGRTTAALSAVTAVELTHGIYRAKTDADRQHRSDFLEELFRALPVYPLNLETGRIAGRISGEQAERGLGIGFADLLIGATALQLGFDLVTLNVRDFERIPGLRVIAI